MAFSMRSFAAVVAIAGPVDAALARMTLLNKLAVNNEAAPDSAAARTLHTLDLNQDGLVDSSEVAAFAKAQGYDGAPTIQEFMGLDANHDGSLDMMELSSALSPDAEAPKAQPEQLTALPAADQTVASSVVALPKTPVTSTALLADASPLKSGQDQTQPDAQAAAALIARELSVQATKEKEARFLDRKAADLRANSTALTRQTVQRVLEAGSKAAASKTTQLLQTLTKLEDQAEEAEVQAAALRAKSRAELEQASDFMTVANAALGTPNIGT